MRPLTDRLPKCLLEAGGKPLIVWHIEKLAAAGFEQVVINHAHLGALIERALGDGSRFGLPIAYSPEHAALETAGGIANALSRLGTAPFAAVNADVYSAFDYAQLARSVACLAQPGHLAHLVLVDNPDHHPGGDFALRGENVALDGALLTFSGIAAYRPEMFVGIARGGKAQLAPLLREHIAAQRVRGEHYRGCWLDIGTPERLARLNRELTAR
jgi:MurNAc alpha-1-phosphate uridylyltransferase